MSYIDDELQSKLNEANDQKDAYLLPENIRKDITVFGITGTYDAGIQTADADATAEDIRKGKTAYVNNEKITGTLNVLDTSDASALTTDIMFPKTAYVKGQKVIGAIVSDYEMTATGMGYERLDLVSSNYILDINEEFGVALTGNFNTTSFAIYEWKNKALGNLIQTISNSFISSSYGNIMHAQISKKLNELGNLNIFYYQHVSGSSTGYMCGFQFDPNTKTVLTSTKASSSCSALDSRHVGNIAVNPVYPNIVAVANQYYTTNGSSAVMKKYNPTSNIFDNTINMGRYHGGGVTGNVCEWDSTGRYLMHCTSKLTPQYAWIEYFNATFTSVSTKLDLSERSGAGAGSQGSNVFCLWNNKYFFWNNTLRDFTNTVKKTYSEFSASYNNNMLWTYDNYLFNCNYSTGKLYCYMIDETTLNLTECFNINITTSKPSTPAKYDLGSPQAPQSNQHMYYKDMATVGVRFDYTDGVRILKSLDFGAEKLWNTNDANATTANVLSGKKAYLSSGPITGTMPNNGNLSIKPGVSDKTLPAGYISGGTVQGDPNLVANNIKKGVTIFGVQGALLTESPTLILNKVEKENEADEVDITFTDSNNKPLLLTDGKYWITTDPIYCNITQNSAISFKKPLSIESDKKLNVTIYENNIQLKDNFNNNSTDLLGRLTTYTKATSGSLSFNTIASNKGLYTNGSSYITYTLGNSISNYDISFDFYKSNTASYSRVCSIGGPGYEIEIKGSSNTIYWGADYSANWKQNQWNTLRLKKSGSTVTLYMNGTAIVSKTYSQVMTNIRLGRGNDSGNYFTGYYKNLIIKDGSKTIIEPVLELEDGDSILEYTPDVLPQTHSIGSSVNTIKIKGTGITTYGSIDEMNLHKDLPNNTLAIIQNANFEGFYQLINNEWIQLGEPVQEVLAMIDLNNVNGTNDTYTGLGDTIENINKDLDDILGS